MGLFSDIIEDPNAGVLSPEEAGFAGITQPNPVAHLNTAPASPAELEKRKAGWAAVWEKFNTDPNLQRAFGMAGAMLAQPMQPGQTNAGNISNAFMVGTNAYQQGEAAQRAQAAGERKEGREIESHQSQLRSQDSSRASIDQQTRERTSMEPLRPRALQADISGREQQTTLEGLRGVREQQAGQREEELHPHRLGALQTTDEVARQGLDERRELLPRRLANMDSQTRENDAQARSHESRASIAEETAAIIQGLAPEERKEFLLKTGRHSGSQHTSAMAQQVALYSEIYDKLPDTHPVKQSGQTKEEFLLEKTSAGKTQSAVKDLETIVKSADLAGTLKSPETQELIGLANRAIKATMESRAGAGTPAPRARDARVYKPGDLTGPEADEMDRREAGKAKPAAKPAAKSNAPAKINSQEEFDKLPSGAVFIGPDGVKRRKP